MTLFSGPLFIGRLVDDIVGVCFIWGIIVDGRFLYTGITYTSSMVFLIFTHIPHFMLLSIEVADRYRTLLTPDNRCYSPKLKISVFVLILSVQMLMGTLLMSAYGYMALLTSFLYFWSAVIYGFCWYQASSLTRSHFIEFRDFENLQRETTSSHASAGDSSSNEQTHPLISLAKSN